MFFQVRSKYFILFIATIIIVSKKILSVQMLIKENLIVIDCKQVLRAINIKYNDQLMTTVFYQRFEQRVDI